MEVIIVHVVGVTVSAATYLWVETYGPDGAPGVASFVLVSTVLSVIALPLVPGFWVCSACSTMGQPVKR
jgi:hypothetical protein